MSYVLEENFKCRMLIFLFISIDCRHVNGWHSSALHRSTDYPVRSHVNLLEAERLGVHRYETVFS